jgi:hypothetical protein
MTLLQLRTQMAAYLQRTVSELIINGADLTLMALNNVRRQAEMVNDFEFSRKQVTISVNRMSGGTLLDAVLDGSPSVEVKSVIEVGIYDDNFNLQPVEWTTVSESIERTRQVQPRLLPRYPTDSSAMLYHQNVGLPRIAFCGDDIWCVPTGDINEDFDLEIEAYTFQQDWDAFTDSVTVSGVTNPMAVNATYWQYGIYNSRPLYINIQFGSPGVLYAIWWDNVGEWRVTTMADLGVITPPNRLMMTATTMTPAGAYAPTGTWTASTTGWATVSMIAGSDTSGIWLTKGCQYLLWAGIVEVNHMAKEFVFRQEGNLPPPEKLRDDALETFKMWDSFKYEQDRRHVY